MADTKARSRKKTGTIERQVTIDLIIPIKVAGAETKQLTVRRPTVGDRLIVEEGNDSEAKKEVAFLSNLCGLAPDEFRQIDLADYQEVQEVVGNFTSSTQQTSEE